MHLDNSDDGHGNFDGEVEFVNGTGYAFKYDGEHREGTYYCVNGYGNAKTAEDVYADRCSDCEQSNGVNGERVDSASHQQCTTVTDVDED